MFNLSFSPDAINLVLSALGKMPYEQVAGTIEGIKRECTKQHEEAQAKSKADLPQSADAGVPA